ncbi:MAG: phosphocholine cytidylyltransferase family protein [Bacteroidales bacterium]|jgi:choline kinase|nr:phosphocholine cytidylyltransferase family protein [Bacteroidales bacterium]
MEDIKTAIILAAGRGTRLKEMTNDIPKPMIKINDKSIIRNLIEQLIDEGIDRIIVLVGYMSKIIEEHLKEYKKEIDLIFIENKIYATTNNIYTLWLAKDYMQGGFYLFEADIFCEKALIKNLLTDNRDNIMLVGKFTSLMNGTVIRNNKDSDIVNKMYLKKEQTKDFDYSDTYKTVNFYKIGKNFVKSFFQQKLEYHIKSKDTGSYYELIIKEAIDKDHVFYSIKANENKWWEIDNQEDLEIAKKTFKSL